MRVGGSSLRSTGLLVALLAPLAMPSSAVALPSSLKSACVEKDAADNNPGNGFQLAYFLCDDRVPGAGSPLPVGGRFPNQTGANAVTVPQKYNGYKGLPEKIDPDANAGADSNRDIALDVDVSLPDPDKFPPPAGGYPLVVFMHGCCSGNKTSWEAQTVDAPDSSEKWHHSNAWFASRGYAVLTYTARGFVNGQGDGSTGEAQLDHRSYEMNDFQHLAGQLVDDPFVVGGQTMKIDPQKVVTVGGSYGGGFSWMALTDPVWRSPAGADMRLAASAPKYGWTDLAYSLVPNGTHMRGQLPAFDGGDTKNPFGLPKTSVVDGLFVSGATGLPPGFEHTTFPPSLTDDFACLSSPLPTGSNPQCAQLRDKTLPGFIEDRSAYYQNDFFAGLANGSIQPVPLFNSGTLTDPLFPGHEDRRMVERLKSTRSDYPVKEYYGDFQHFVQNKRKEWSDLCGADHHVCAYSDYPGGDLNAEPNGLAERGVNTRLSRFFDHYAKPPGNSAEPRPAFDVTSSVQICPSNASDQFKKDEPGPRFTAPTFGELAPNTLEIRREGEQRTTNVAAPNHHAANADPVFQTASRSGACPTEASPAGPGVATYDSPALGRTFTMIGPTRVAVPYSGSGGDLQLNARMYDVFPGGEAVMVDRGFRALTASQGTAVFELLGNGWRFDQGHKVRIELAQDDKPYVKQSTVPSSLELTGVTLRIPVREASATIRANRGRGDGGGDGAGGGDARKEPVATTAGSGEGGELPFTGFSLLPPVLLGMALIASGSVLRRRVEGASPARGAPSSGPPR